MATLAKAASIAVASIGEVSAVAKASIGKVAGVDAPVAITWETQFTTSWGAQDAGNSGYSFRQVVPAAAITRSGTRVKVVIAAGTTEGLKLDFVSIVEQDTGADGVTTPTELLFSGGHGCDIAANGTATSDDTAFIIDEAKSYIVVTDVSSDTTKDNNAKATGATGWTSYLKAAVDTYNQQTVTGFSEQASVVEFVQSIIVGY